MARTDRSSAASAAAMDELNLDDLFMGGGDGGGDDLFAALGDMDFGGFDDISAPGGGGGGGDGGSGSGSRRDLPGAGSMAAMGPSASPFDALDYGSSSVATSIFTPPDSSSTKKSQRRKRKTKKMLASEGQGDVSDDDYEQRLSAAKAASKANGRAKGGRPRKKKAEAGEADAPMLPTAAKNKRKSKTTKNKSAGMSPLSQSFGSESMMPPPLPRPGPGGVNVAALPKHLQGSAVFASGQLPSPAPGFLQLQEDVAKKTKTSKSKKRKTQKGDDSIRTSAPLVDPSFCGLAPNTASFYPFMPIPAEVAMRKLHKALPTLDRIHTIVAHISEGVATGGKNGAASSAINGQMARESDSNPLFRLFIDHLGALETSHSHARSSSPATAANGTATAPPGPAEVTANVHNNLSEARKAFMGERRTKLRDEVMRCLALVRRQSTFLGTSLANMESWCKQNFSEEEYTEGFIDVPPPDSSGKRSNWGRAGSIGKSLPEVTSTTPVYVNIRVKCKGFREPASVTARLGGGPLVAQLPIPPEVASAAGATSVSPTSKRRSRSPAAAVSGTASALASVPYEHLALSERRRLVSRAISTKAYELDRIQKKLKTESDASRADRLATIAQIIKDDPVEVCHTTTLWQIMKHSPYVADLTEDDIREGLSEAWQPELASREIHWGEIPPIRIQRSRSSSRKRKREEMEAADNAESKASLESKMFDRLQSLLVDVEGGEGEDINDNVALSTKSEDNPLDTSKASVFASDPRKEHPFSALTKDGGEGKVLLDLSKLTIDQRAYIQLRALGLADVPLLPSAMPFVEEETAVGPGHPSKDSAVPDKVHTSSYSAVNGERNTAANDAKLVTSNGAVRLQDDDLDLVVRRMQDDLSDVHHGNNVRAAMLQAAAMEQLHKQRQLKRRDGESSSLIAKHTQVIKKQKEAQTKRAPKPKASKDENWLPW